MMHDPINIRFSTRIFPAFYVTRRFITVFTRASKLFLSAAIRIQSTFTHYNALRSSLILSPHPRVDFQSVNFLPDFLQPKSSVCSFSFAFVPISMFILLSLICLIWLLYQYLAIAENHAVVHSTVFYRHFFCFKISTVCWGSKCTFLCNSSPQLHTPEVNTFVVSTDPIQIKRQR